MAEDEEIDEAIAGMRPRSRLHHWYADGSSWLFTRTVLLRLLGVVYFAAFLGALRQGRALVGQHGLLPLDAYLRAVGRISKTPHFDVPTLFWLSPTDAMWSFLAALGCVLALLVVAGMTNAGVMLALCILQTSIANVGQTFWSFGWEIQLVETGMLAVFLCPMRTVRPFASAPPVVAIWLFRWLIVRIMLGAGLIKLRGDPCWRDLTCLVTHYETQPNPNPVSWFLHQMPRSLHIGGVVVNHFVELVVPFFVVGPRRVRQLAGLCLVGFQAVLIVSGNLAFLNWLTIVPALACFDDSFFARILRRRPPARVPRSSAWHRRVAIAYACLVGVLSIAPVLNLFSARQEMNASFDPLHLVNTYGAFGSVNRVRDELVIAGSNDGVTWNEYELPCKPGNVERRPCLVTPYHYRLDWQMWFAAMASYEDEPWLVVLVDKLLRGEHAIDPLLDRNPFPDAPPKLIRVDRYRYELTRFGSGKAWWKRGEVREEYMRPLSLDDPELEEFLRMHSYR